MFEFFDNIRDRRLTSDSKIDAVVNRLNMGRLYTFSLIACLGVLLVTAIFALFGIYVLPESYQTLGFIVLAVIFMIFSVTINLLVRSRASEVFDKICYSYIGVVSVVLFTFAFRAKAVIPSMIFYMLLIMFISLVPVLAPVRYLIIWGIEMALMVTMAAVRHLDVVTITSFVLISIMGLMLSFICYSGLLRKLDYKLSLDLAISEAETDPMTGLLNRRGLEHRIENIWALCIRQQIKIAVIMIDIDNFKKYNDAFGHPEGDECIKAVTGMIRKCIRRRTDYGARVGGEEFLVLLTDIEASQAIRWTLNLQKSIADLKIPHASTNFSPYVSISAGISTATVYNDTEFEKLREEADQALYESKRNGRDRIYYHGKCYRPKSSAPVTQLLEEAN